MWMEQKEILMMRKLKAKCFGNVCDFKPCSMVKLMKISFVSRIWKSKKTNKVLF